MQLTINDHRKVYALQEEFHQAFPNLLLEFFEKPSKVGAAAPKKMVVRATQTIGQCRNTHKKGLLTITPGMTVADLERDFDDVYGLSVEILQRSGNSWTKADANIQLASVNMQLA